MVSNSIENKDRLCNTVIYLIKLFLYLEVSQLWTMICLWNFVICWKLASCGSCVYHNDDWPYILRAEIWVTKLTLVFSAGADHTIKAIPIYVYIMMLYILSFSLFSIKNNISDTVVLYQCHSHVDSSPEVVRKLIFMSPFGEIPSLRNDWNCQLWWIWMWLVKYIIKKNGMILVLPRWFMGLYANYYKVLVSWC